MQLRNRLLEDWQAEYLYKHHKGLGRSPSTYCPTCLKTGSYQWAGTVHECDCAYQLNLHKLYLWAGIGVTYQRLTWDDWHGDPDIPKVARTYIEKGLARRGTGLFFPGTFGAGKTMACNLILKDLVKAGMSCYATTFSSMIEKYTGGWRDDEEREVFTEQVRDSDVLLLDDVGRSQRTSAAARNFHESTFDDVLRPRVQGGKATLITTNLESRELREGYGSAILSLLREHAIAHTFTGEDYRETAGNRNTDEQLRGEVRPIV